MTTPHVVEISRASSHVNDPEHTNMQNQRIGLHLIEMAQHTDTQPKVVATALAEIAIDSDFKPEFLRAA